MVYSAIVQDAPLLNDYNRGYIFYIYIYIFIFLSKSNLDNKIK